ncbi:CocE/NonD family hydrolase [Kribbella catacumbae]|uniref:CocE/NonD family hydrolase n=1 Tax=Kribbella catacumbae TaxID=460086 RepID=UPI000A06F8D3|nr:CocE/NonD family hydrolase [Kribbella catacumbae]
MSHPRGLAREGLRRARAGDDGTRVTKAVEANAPGTSDGTRVTQAEYDYKTATSPYFARPKAAAKSGRRMFEPAVDDDYKDLEDDGTPSKFPDYFVPRGYAVVLVDLPGTRASEGCLTTGGRGEPLGAKAVVDWIGGRAQAVNKAGQAVAANWSTGKVGMVGRSYRGTTPLAVAATDVPNLKTIVPISAVGSWYDYYMRHNGVVRQGDWRPRRASCDRTAGRLRPGRSPGPRCRQG